MRQGTVVGLAAAAVAIAVGSACRPRAESPPIQSNTVTVVGTVASLGPDPVPQIVVQSEGRAPVAVLGDLKEEIAQLIGLRVRVIGTEGEGPPPTVSAVVARSYEIMDLNGMPVHMGLLESVDDTLWLVTGAERLVLSGAPEDLRQALGSRIWVAGEVQNQTLRLSAYGVIKKAGPS